LAILSEEQNTIALFGIHTSGLYVQKLAAIGAFEMALRCFAMQGNCGLRSTTKTARTVIRRLQLSH
jgi:hypothetical protein